MDHKEPSSSDDHVEEEYVFVLNKFLLNKDHRVTSASIQHNNSVVLYVSEHERHDINVRDREEGELFMKTLYDTLDRLERKKKQQALQQKLKALSS